MKYCAHCKVSVTGHWKRCPLCQNTLTGEDSPDVFPIVEKPHTNRLFLQLLIFLSIAAAAICGLINSTLPQTGAWSVFVIAGILCMWISVGIAILKRRSLLKNIAWQAFAFSVLAILWDYFTHWHAWSVNFVVPCILVFTMLLTPLLIHFLNLPLGTYLVYISLVFLFGLIPAIFLLLHIPTIALPSLICVGFSLISLAALLAFHGRKLLQELQRRLHM